MRFFLLSIFILAATATNADARSCNVKAIYNEVDGKVYYDKEHRLHKYVKLKTNDVKLCSADEAEEKGFRPAPATFADSTARLVECTENGDVGCQNYVIGQYHSLAIYDRACAGTESTDIIVDGFIREAKADKKNLDVEKFYGTTSALMKAFPCR